MARAQILMVLLARRPSGPRESRHAHSRCMAARLAPRPARSVGALCSLSAEPRAARVPPTINPALLDPADPCRGARRQGDGGKTLQPGPARPAGCKSGLVPLLEPPTPNAVGPLRRQFQLHWGCVACGAVRRSAATRRVLPRHRSAPRNTLQHRRGGEARGSEGN